MHLNLKSFHLALFYAAIAAFFCLVPARAFDVRQATEVTVVPVVKPNNSPIVGGEYIVRVGYFTFDLANFEANNTQIAANADSQSVLESKFVEFFRYTGAQEDNGTAGVNGGNGAAAGGPGTFYTYFLTTDTAMKPGGAFNQFSGKQFYVWIQLVATPSTQAIFADERVRFAGGNDAFTDASATVSYLPQSSFTRTIVGTQSSSSLKLAGAEATAELSFSSNTSSVSEASGNVSVTVSRTGATNTAVSVTFNTQNGTAIAGTDYTAKSGSLNFAAGDTSETISVPIANRANFQGNRNFEIVLSNPTPSGGASLGSNTRVTVTIQEDDPIQNGTLQFTVDSLSISENGGSAKLTVTRTGGVDGAVGVGYSTSNGTATAGIDYTATSGTLKFPAGSSTSQTISIPIANLAGFSGNRTFIVRLSSATGGAQLGANDEATVTITEDDAPPVAGTLQFSASTANVNENAGTLTVTVTRANGSGGAVSVKYATSSATAAAGADFSSTTGTLNWAAGDTASKTFSVPITNDVIDESDETFSIRLSDPTKGAIVSTPGTLMVTIKDNDTAGALTFASATVTVSENAGSASVKVKRTDGSDGVLTVHYATSNGTAIAGTHYTATSGTLTFPNGTYDGQYIKIPILDNNAFGGSKSFTISLSSPTNGASLGATKTATVTIQENDSPAFGKFEFKVTAVSVKENAGNVALTVLRTGGTDGQVAVNYATASQTAKAGEDFSTTTGTLTFPPGTSEKTFSVPIIDNALFELSETFLVKLSNPTGGASIGTKNEATVTTTDNDTAITFSLVAPALPIAEGGTTEVIIRRTGPTSTSATVKYRTKNGTAVDQKPDLFGNMLPADYIAANESVTFAPGETQRVIQVRTLDDIEVEAAETFRFELQKFSDSDTSVALGSPSAIDITIQSSSEGTDQPDLLVAPGSDGGSFLGSQIYNTSGDGQISVQNGSRGKTLKYRVRLTNRGPLPDAARLTVSETATAKGSSFRYYYRDDEISSQLRSSAGMTFPTQEKNANIDIEVEVKLGSGASNLTSASATFQASSIATPTKMDVVRVAGLVVE